MELALAIAHHVLVFGLVSMLMAERVLTRPGMSGADAVRVSRLDAGYGGTAALIIVVGVCRVIWGGKGWPYYVDNPWFWAKMASFALIGLLSVPPTARFLKWRKAAVADPLFTPGAAEIVRVRRFLDVQSLLVIAVLVFAAAMARYSG
jgi:putative membrane protein